MRSSPSMIVCRGGGPRCEGSVRAVLSALAREGQHGSACGAEDASEARPASEAQALGACCFSAYSASATVPGPLRVANACAIARGP
jgi:hypothetical protein